MKNFPIYPIVKIARFRQRHNVAESGQFLQWGSMGKLFTRCQICMKFVTGVLLKPSNLSLIGQEVNIISLKMKLTIDSAGGGAADNDADV